MRKSPVLTVLLSGLLGAVFGYLASVLLLFGTVYLGEWLREQPRWDTVGDFARPFAWCFGLIGTISGLLYGCARGILMIGSQREQCPGQKEAN
jgi:hypothetical protein